MVLTPRKSALVGVFGGLEIYPSLIDRGADENRKSGITAGQRPFFFVSNYGFRGADENPNAEGRGTGFSPIFTRCPNLSSD